MIPSTELKTRVLESARREAAPTRLEARKWRIVALGASMLIGAILGIAMIQTWGSFFRGSRPLAFIVGTALGWVGLAGVASWIALGGRSMLGRPRMWLLGLAVAAPLLLLGWMSLWNAFFPTTLEPCPTRPGRMCADVTISFALVPLVAVLLLRRNSDPVHPGATGAVLGLAAGTWAGIVIDLSCGCADPVHVARGHILPVIGLMLLGTLLGRRILGLHVR